MDGTGAFPAARIIPAYKGTIPARTSIFIGKPLYMVSHFETTIRAVNQTSENTLDAVRGFGLPHPLLVDADHRIPNFTGDNRLMGPLHTNPFFFRLCYQLLGFVGDRAVFALDHVADINLILDYHRNSGAIPQVIDTAGIAAALPLIVQLTGWLNTFGI